MVRCFADADGGPPCLPWHRIEMPLALCQLQSAFMAYMPSPIVLVQTSESAAAIIRTDFN